MTHRETGLRKAQRDTKGKTQTRQMTEQKNTDSDSLLISQLTLALSLVLASVSDHLCCFCDNNLCGCCLSLHSAVCLQANKKRLTGPQTANWSFTHNSVTLAIP